MTTGYQSLLNSVGVRHNTRDVIRASGDDTTQFLQGQLSQDVAALAVGSSAMSLLLQPQGKINAYLRVTCQGENDFVLDVDAGFGEAAIKRLSRFLLRTKCTIEMLDWQSVSLRGPQAEIVAAAAQATIKATDDTWLVPSVDLLGPEITLPADAAGLDEVTLDDWTALRIESGVPMMGAELNENTIPEAAGIVDGSVSFTKGCYTGQELVARVDSRGGNVPQRLRVVVIEADTVPRPGTELVHETGPAGTITSAAWSPRFGSPVALAYVARKVEIPSILALGSADGEPAHVKELPLALDMGR